MRPDLDPNYFTLMVFLKDFFFRKVDLTTKNVKKYLY